MSLTLVKNPKFKKAVEYSYEDKEINFKEFMKKARHYHDLHHNLGKKKTDREQLHWKDELFAVINPKDLNKFADAVGFYCGSELEVLERISRTKVLVYASGYWVNIGS